LFFSIFIIIVSLSLSLSPLPPTPLPPRSVESDSFAKEMLALRREIERIAAENDVLAKLLVKETSSGLAELDSLGRTANVITQLALVEKEGDLLTYGLPARLSAVEVNLWNSTWMFGENDRLVLAPYRNLSLNSNLTLSYEWLVTGKNVSGKLLQHTSSAVGPSPVAICADEAGQNLYTAHSDGRIRQWDAVTLELRGTQTLSPAATIQGMDVSRDKSATIAVALKDGTATIIDFERWKVTAQFKVDLNGDLRKVVFASDGLSIFAAGADTFIHHVSLNGTELDVYKGGHTGTVLALALSGNDTIMASGDEAGTLVIWDVATATILDHEDGSHPPIVSAAISSDANFAVFGASKGRAKLLGLREGSTWDNAYTYLTWCNADGGICDQPVQSVQFSRRSTHALITAEGVSYAERVDGDYQWTREMYTDRVAAVDTTMLPDDSWALLLANGTILVWRKLETSW
jgi:WD40 repeat protein